MNSLKEIEKTKSPLIIYKKTKDRKLLNYIEKMELPYKELDSEISFEISTDFEIKIFPYDKGDSVIEYKLKNLHMGDFVIINTNDCEFGSKKELSDFIDVNKICKNPNILLTQFSYACWQSNGENKNKRMKAAEKKLNHVKDQIEIFNPKIKIPFASFIYFCHQENSDHNDFINTPDIISNWFGKVGISRFQFMKPMDNIQIDENPDPAVNSSALDYWRNKFEMVSLADKIKSKSYSEKEIFDFSFKYARKNINFLKKESSLDFIIN